MPGFSMAFTQMPPRRIIMVSPQLANQLARINDGVTILSGPLNIFFFNVSRLGIPKAGQWSGGFSPSGPGGCWAAEIRPPAGPATGAGQTHRTQCLLGPLVRSPAGQAKRRPQVLRQGPKGIQLNAETALGSNTLWKMLAHQFCISMNRSF